MVLILNGRLKVYNKIFGNRILYKSFILKRKLVFLIENLGIIVWLFFILILFFLFVILLYLKL